MSSIKPLAFLLGSSILMCFFVFAPSYLEAQPGDGVAWIGEKQDAALWQAIRSDFHEELQPDDPAKTAPVLAYSYKYIYRVAKYRDSALVIVGHQETEGSKYPGYYSAFNYDLRSRARVAIKGAEVVSVFKFVKFLSLGPPPEDIAFTWMTCTECEASQVLSMFHYDAGSRRWLLRSWETDKDIWWTSDSGPSIWTDVSASDIISFDCLHGFLSGGSSDVFGMRCREVDDEENGKRKVTDLTVRYTFDEASSKLEILRGEAGRTELLNRLCRQSPRNKLCQK